MEKRFLVGSRAFFSEMPNFHSKDTDILIWTDTPKDFKFYKQVSMGGKCTFYWTRQSKRDLIEYAKREKASGLEFGKFLVPDFINEIDLNIEDLKSLAKIFLPKLDINHKYQELIYNAYIKNNGFYLTDKQRDDVYKEYIKSREG